MHPIDAVLLRFHQLVRAQPLFYRLAIGTRLLLAAGFIPTGMVKLLGQRFTVMSVETPVGMSDLPRAADVPLRVHRLGRAERAVYVIGGAGGMLFFVGTRGFVPGPLPWAAMLVAAICVLAAAGMAVHAQVRCDAGASGMRPGVQRDAVQVAAGQS